MTDIKIPVVALEPNKFQVVIDTNIYAKEVITSAIYKFSHLFYIYQQTDNYNQNRVNVIFESKEGNIISCSETILQRIDRPTNSPLHECTIRIYS